MSRKEQIREFEAVLNLWCDVKDTEDKQDCLALLRLNLVAPKVTTLKDPRQWAKEMRIPQSHENNIEIHLTAYGNAGSNDAH